MSRARLRGSNRRGYATVSAATGRQFRNHLHETAVQRAVKEAVRRAEIPKPGRLSRVPALLRDPIY